MKFSVFNSNLKCTIMCLTTILFCKTFCSAIDMITTNIQSFVSVSVNSLKFCVDVRLSVLVCSRKFFEGLSQCPIRHLYRFLSECVFLTVTPPYFEQKRCPKMVLFSILRWFSFLVLDHFKTTSCKVGLITMKLMIHFNFIPLVWEIRIMRPPSKQVSSCGRWWFIWISI